MLPARAAGGTLTVAVFMQNVGGLGIFLVRFSTSAFEMSKTDKSAEERPPIFFCKHDGRFLSAASHFWKCKKIIEIHPSGHKVRLGL